MTRSHRLLLSLALMVIGSATAATATSVTAAPPAELPGRSPAEARLDDDGPWVFRVAVWTPRQLHDIASHFDHVGFDREAGALIVHADSEADRELLGRVGVIPEIDPERTARLRWIEAWFDAGVESLGGIPGFECYRTVEQTLAVGADLAAANPTLASWIDVGDSWELLNPGNGGDGFDLWALVLTNSAVPGPKPALLVTAAVHAREYATAELVTRFAEMLVDGYGVDPDITWILDHHEIHLMLQSNPDARKRAEGGLSWRKNANNTFCTDSNNRGVDLNRNFDFQWACCGGGSNGECDATYRGPAARSEPESQVIMDYMDALFPDQRPDDLVTPAPDTAEGIYFDVHAFGEILLTSWGFTTDDPPNADAILTLARKYSFFPDYVANLGSLGTVDGASKDYAYGRLGVPSATVELGTDFFESCTEFESDILPGNLAGLLHAAKNVRTPYVTPGGPDAVALTLSLSSVPVGQPVTLTATIDDTRYSTAAEPTHTVVAADAFLDTPPWAGGTPVPMTASDGSFDATIETVEVELDTTGLEPGRHLVFVRGRDATATDGAVSAIFLEITADVVFADGFESGDTSAWSTTVP